MRYYFLDNIKGIAILLVVAVHFNGYMTIDGMWAKLCTEGASMPQLFFIISSYLLWRSLEKKEVKSWQDYLGYLKAKWLRLSPVYYIALLLSVIIAIAINNPLKSVVDYLMHLTYTNGLVPQFTNDILGVEWYISVLAIFYFIAPALKKYVVNLSGSLALLIFSMSLSGFTTYIIAPPICRLDEITHTYLIATGWISELPTLSLGIVLYYLNQFTETNSKRNIDILILVFLLVFTLTVSSKYLLSFGVQIITGWRAMAYILVLFLILRYWRNMQKIPVISNLGKQSYGIYCYHIIFIQLLKMSSLRLETNTCNWLLMYVAVIIISYTFTMIVERLTTINR